MDSTLRKVYLAIITIPVSAILLAGAIGGGSSTDYERYSNDLTTTGSGQGGFAGSGKSEAEAYSSLGKYNPCIFIECEGE
jgi:hypothetical protein